MSFKSILKKSLTSGLLQQKLSAPELIVTLLVTVFFAVYILILYRKMTKSTFYSRTFGISLVMLSVVTAGMILSMQANFVITFGMRGISVADTVPDISKGDGGSDLYFLERECGASVWGILLWCGAGGGRDPDGNIIFTAPDKRAAKKCTAAAGDGLSGGGRAGAGTGKRI